MVPCCSQKKNIHRLKTYIYIERERERERKRESERERESKSGKITGREGLGNSP
jgi:hypothetical protein